MSILGTEVQTLKTASGTLKIDDIKKLIAADLGVDPRYVSLVVKLRSPVDDGPGYSRQEFDQIQFEVKQPV